jgi:hypothetical protein
MGSRAISYHVPAYRVRSTEATVGSDGFGSTPTQLARIKDQLLRMRREAIFTVDSRDEG